MHGNVWISRNLIYNELQNVVRKDLEAGFFAKATKKCKFLSNLLVKEVGSLVRQGFVNFQ